MGYLNIALTVIKNNPVMVNDTDQDHKLDFYTNTHYEINEINEKNPSLVIEEGLTRTFQELFEKAVAEVGAWYLPGTLEIIREDFPDLAGEMQLAEDQVNELWLKARKGLGDMGALSEAVENWESLHLRAIRFFSLMESHSGAAQLSQD
jgi:hypothetical protein